MPMSAAYIFTERWMMGVAVCQIWIGVDYTASTASILNLFILSLDRYWSVRQPLKYLHKRTKRRALSMIAVVWVVSSLWIIPIASWHYFAHGGVRTVPHDNCDTEYAKNSLFKVITAFFNFYLPLSVMFILYFRIFIAIRKRSKFEMGHRYPGGTVISFKSSNNVTGMHSLDDSDYMNEDVEGRPNHNSFYHGNHQQQSEDHHGRTGSRQNGTRNPVPNGCRHLRLMAASCSLRGRGASGSTNGGGRGRGRGINSGDIRCNRGGGGTCKRRDFTTSASRYKVEYIYDENVMDPQTEKIERYFYEDSYPLPRTNRGRWTSTKTNNDNKIASSKSSAISSSASSSSSSTFPSTQRSVRFRSSLHPVTEAKASQKLSVPPAQYHSGYSETPCSMEYHQQLHKTKNQRQQKQQPPPEHFMTVGGKTTAVLKRNLFKRQRNLDEDESKVCLRGGSKTTESKGNDKSRSRFKLETFRRNKPAETSFSPSLAVNASSSLSSSSASTFGDSMENKWVADVCSNHCGAADGGCASRNSRAGCGCCLQIDEQIRLDTSTNNPSAPSHSSPGGLRVHRGKEMISTCADLNRSAAPSENKAETIGCCGCRRGKNVDQDDEDDDDDDDDAELSSFSLNTRCDSKSRRGTGGATSERVGVASSGSVPTGVSGLKERLKTMRQSSSLNKEIKAARQLGVIMGAFTLCFLPYFILFMVVAFCDDCVSPGHLTTATWVGYLNSTLNPFLYPLCNANFRVKFRSMLSCCSKGRSGSGRLGLRRRNHDFARASVYHSRYD
ncbi:orphan G-protein coupled receptor 30 [Elysia marginata]|uniref:Orphan G-protein coupled receptor 30 n=1 Tax=Elysia marginata TaxID=1093978 RepID=A0AAV4GDF1_9GAST|nr:orphan G-protein coupled receptor 30 [Elysia marginata]